MDRISIRLEQDGPVNAIKMTRQFLHIPLFKVYAFFIDGLMIDTGFAHGRDKFLAFCDTIHPETVVNTHHHEDHTGNNFWITKKYGLLPLAHPKTSSYLQTPSQWVPFYRRVVCGCPHPSETDQVDSEIQTRNFRFMVINTPGHTEDHICLYEPNEGWLFSGDLFVSEQVKYLRKGEEIYSIIDSLKKVVVLHPKKMFCCFSGIVDQAEEAIHRKIEYLRNLKKEVEKGLQQGLSAREMQRRLLGRGDRFSFISAGQFSKENLINDILKAKRG
jgi:ribonuclease/clavin/mitogillin